MVVTSVSIASLPLSPGAELVLLSLNPCRGDWARGAVAAQTEGMCLEGVPGPPSAVPSL